LTPEDVALAEEALQGCPVEAIGNDGVESAEAAEQSTSTTAKENSQP
jgi:hypothetical protein